MDAVQKYISEMSNAQKLQLVEQLWDQLTATPNAMPIPDSQIEELDRRKANLQRHPDSALSWDELERRVRGRHGG